MDKKTVETIAKINENFTIFFDGWINGHLDDKQFAVGFTKTMIDLESFKNECEERFKRCNQLSEKETK